MGERDERFLATDGRPEADGTFDLDALLHPARVFAHPSDVVHDPALSLAEKRAILASWASDACAVEAAPALRSPPGAAKPVAFDDVMDALRALDDARNGHNAGPQRTRLARGGPGASMKGALRRRLGIASSIAVKTGSTRRSGPERHGLDG